MRRLPVDCIAHILSMTSPRDVCRSSAVSRLFETAAGSDAVWDKFLPPRVAMHVKDSSSSSSLISMPRKALYFRICTHPIIVGDGHESFAIDKQSGKICYMVGARGLTIAYAENPAFWEWMTIPHSRFSEVAKLNFVWLLDIRAPISSSNLSPGTLYAAYLVYQLSEVRVGLARTHIVLRINYRQHRFVKLHSVILDPMPQRARHRGDGWIEIEMGQFSYEQRNDDDDDDDDDVVECSVKEVSNPKSGLIVEGIELRPL